MCRQKAVVSPRVVMWWDSLHNCPAVMDDGSSGRKKIEKTERPGMCSMQRSDLNMQSFAKQLVRDWAKAYGSRGEKANEHNRVMSVCYRLPKPRLKWIKSMVISWEKPFACRPCFSLGVFTTPVSVVKATRKGASNTREQPWRTAS